jgi:hypothetical protein
MTGKLFGAPIGASLRVVAIVLAAAFLALAIFRISIAGVLQDRNPAMATALAPFDAGATAQMASLAFGTARDAEGRSRARDLARRAIEQDPMSVPAVRTLALIADREGDGARAMRLIAHSYRLSRRDRLTHIWLIGYYQSRGDIAGMVRQFDLALRTSRRARESLLPLLVASTTDRRVVAPVRSILAAEPGWWLSFADQLAATTPRPAHAVAILQGLLDPDVPEERLVIERLLGRLTERGEFALASAVHARATGQQAVPSGGRIRSGDFEGPAGFAPFDWSLAGEPELGAFREPKPSGGSALAVVAYNGRTGEVARQLLNLSPGRYRIQMEAGNIPSDLLDRPRLAVTCSVEGATRTLIEVRPSFSGASARRLSAVFSVPLGCPWQWLAIAVSGQGPPPESNPWVDNLTISPAAS